MRWTPVITLGIPHANTAADNYDGYYIPKDSIAYGNIQNMHHDSSHYKNADDFVPERYDGFTKSAFEYTQVNNALDHDHYVFGWVRRICAEMHLAQRSVLSVAASVLWAFDIVPAKDVQGRDINVSADPATAYHHSVVGSPKLFPVQFKVRSEKRRKVIEASLNNAQSTWDTMGLDLYA